MTKVNLEMKQEKAIDIFKMTKDEIDAWRIDLFDL